MVALPSCASVIVLYEFHQVISSDPFRICGVRLRMPSRHHSASTMTPFFRMTLAYSADSLDMITTLDFSRVRS